MRSRIIKPPPHVLAEIESKLHYDPASGRLTWVGSTSPRVRNGDPAGSINSDGYLLIKVCGKKYKGHHIAWFLYTGEWPENELDHRDGKRANNRIRNLREADFSQNGTNKRVQSNSSLGVPGVDIRNGRYRARIGVRGKLIELGSFATLDEAKEKRREAETQYHGRFAAKRGVLARTTE